MEDNTQIVLVTGGSGFVGSYCVLQLLNAGYRVRATLRSPEKAEKVRTMLQQAGIKDLTRLSFAEADLSRDEGWNEALQDCTYVLHLASPFPGPKDGNGNEIIDPAREGTLRVLESARTAGVKRVVMTSSFAAVGYSRDPAGHVFTENDWTDPEKPGLGVYARSKTLAERDAWNFVQKHGNRPELTVINPVAIFGPVMGSNISGSVQMVVQLLSGKAPGAPKLTFGVVDVRDIADLHIRAMTAPAAAGQRFLATSEGSMSLPAIARLLRKHYPAHKRKIPRRTLPDWSVKILAWFRDDLKQMIPELGKEKIISGEKARTILNWRPRPMKEVIRATADSLIRRGVV